ncbi:MAG: PKD domain-containing protein [Pyrinomonadaceae bacterium]
MFIAPASFTRSIAPPVFFVFFFSLCLFIAPAFSQQRVEVYPKVIRLDKGKTRTITAIAFASDGSYMPNQTFTFSGSSSVASIRKSPEGNTEENNSRFSPNLGEIAGTASGTATFTATLNGVVSNPVAVTVVDPAEMPAAVIRGDNEAEGNTTIRVRVGEAVEVNADLSRGVKLPEWFWGDGDRTSDILSATHAYLAAGSYTLRLRVTNSGGQIAEDQVTVIVTDQPAPTRTFTVTTAAQLLTAYNQCVGGEHIIIPAGTIIAGNIVLPAKAFTDFVTIRSSAVMPDMRVRVDSDRTDLAVIRATGLNELPLQIKNRATKIRLSGIKFEPYAGTPETALNYYLLQIGEAFAQTSTADNPTKIIVDHCVIDPPDNIQVVHAVLNDGYKVSIIGSWFGNVKTYGSQDSQAVFGLDGRGAHVYNNTYFEAASESIMYGGADNRINGMVPTNIEFRRCAFSKPVAWPAAAAAKQRIDT